MRMKKKLSLILWLLLSLSLLFSVYPIEARAASAVCFLNGVEYAELSPEDGKVTLPDVPEGLSGAFAGWCVKEKGKEKLYPPSASIPFVNGARYEGVVISFVTDEGATLRYENGDMGVRFVTRLDKVDYNRLCSLVGGIDAVSFGTLITARGFMFYTDFVFTPEALAEAGYEGRYLDVKTDGFFTEEAKTFTVAGSVSDILDENRARSYVGVGYMEIKYADGTVGRVYSPFDYNKNCSTPFDEVFEAYEDRYYNYPNTIPAGGVHGGPNNTSSNYTVAQHDEMKAFLDSVVAVDLSLDENREYVYIPTTGKYYRSPWIVSYEYANEKDEIFTITVTAPDGMSIKEVKAFLFVGSRISLTAEGITVTENSISARHSNFTPEY